MEKQILTRLDGMIAKHQLLLAEIGAWQGAVPAELTRQVKRMEGGLYALREGVRGFLKAKELGFPLERFDSYLGSIETVANQIDASLSDVIGKVQTCMQIERSRSK